MIIATVMAATWAATFSRAMRRRARGVVSTISRLPRRTSAASVDESARMDHRPVIRANMPE